MGALSLAPVLTPHGRLTLGHVDDGPTLDLGLAERLQSAFARGSGHGLLQLGAGEVGTALPPALSYWRELGTRYVTALCTLPDAEEHGAKVHVPAPPEEELDPLASAAPPMTGAEYLTAAVLQTLWEELDAAFGTELSESRGSVQGFLKRRNSAWNLVGRVHFNLAENRKDEEAPFAFLATYTTRLSAHAKAQHLPLGQALRDLRGRGEQRAPVVAAPPRPARGRELHVVDATDLSNKRIARILFCIHNGQLVLLHGFVKKTQKTPDDDLDLAMKRKKEIQE